MNVATRPDPAATFVGGCLGFVLLVAVSAGGAVAWWSAHRPRPAPPPPVATTPGTPPVAPAPTPGRHPTFAGEMADDEPLDVADPAHADLRDLLPSATRAATTVEPGALLVGINAFELTGGVADLRASHDLTFDYELSSRDPTKPPGKDKIEKMIKVDVDASGYHATSTDWPATRLKHPGFLGGALPAPKCRSRDAWTTAVKSGVPSDAVARLVYYANGPFSPQSPYVWSIRVDGHDEYRREIDAMTCKLVKSWAK